MGKEVLKSVKGRYNICRGGNPVLRTERKENLLLPVHETTEKRKKCREKTQNSYKTEI